MSGDILAAGVLLASVAACKQNSSKAKVAKETECVSEEYALKKLDKTQDTGRRGGEGGCCCSFTSPPYHIFFLALTIGALNLLMATPNFLCSVVAQVLMGTVYVFGIQAVNEIISVLTRGSHSLYRRIMYIARILWDIAVSITGFVALIVYDDMGPAVPFIAVGVGILIFSLIYVAFVAHRYGFRGKISVDELEKVRLLARRQVVEPEKDEENAAVEMVIV